VCLFAWPALLPARAGAQAAGRSPAPEELWKAYPLDPTTAEAEPKATALATASAVTKRRPLAAAGSDDDAAAPVIVLALLALLGAGGVLTIRSTRRGGKREPLAAATPKPRAYTMVKPVPTRPHGGSGRFVPAAARNRGSRATAVVGSERTRGGPPAPAPAPSPPAREPSPAAPRAAAASPPDRGLAWTAEIEWRHDEGESRFCVIARGPDTVTLAQSPPLEWPPSGPAAVQAMTDAVEKLSATLAAAGWKALPPGHSWYAKRFAWEPAGTEPAPAEPPAPRPAPVRRRRLALLCVLLVLVLGALAAVQLSRGGDDGRQARPTATATATATAGRNATATPPDEPRGTDLTLPLLVLLALIPAVLVVRETRRSSR
jgi:hypothetical protein